jgi:signal transduction histidine kinase
MTPSRLIGIAGLVAWLIVGLRAVVAHATAGAVQPFGAGWLATYLLFGALFAASSRRPHLLLVAAQAAAALGLTLLGCNGYEGILLALVAMQLGLRLAPPAGMLWIGGQTVLLTAALALQFNPRAAWLLGPPYLGFQIVAFFTFSLMARQVAARAALANANAELHAMQAMLADRCRVAERLRIAHELHDALGHRLTALTLNLEAALQRSQGPARSHVEVAQSLARGLLADVRDIVAGARSGDGVDVAVALRALVSAVPRPCVHLNVAADLCIADPERAHVLLRCTQEIVTNAARHSAAQNLWITVERDGTSFRIAAHDDGRGSAESRHGFGLRGMRERLERVGGELCIASRPGRGFDVSARLPAGKAAL